MRWGMQLKQFEIHDSFAFLNSIILGLLQESKQLELGFIWIKATLEKNDCKLRLIRLIISHWKGLLTTTYIHNSAVPALPNALAEHGN